MSRRSIRRAALALACGLLVTACSGARTKTVVTPLSNQPIGATGAGIPFQLTRPVFRLTEKLASPSNPVTRYVLEVGYEPDPHQRFTINLHTPKLSEADLKLVFGEIGNLSQLNSAARDQLVPTLVAIGEFAGRAITLAATASAGVPVLVSAPSNEAVAAPSAAVEALSTETENYLALDEAASDWDAGRREGRTTPGQPSCLPEPAGEIPDPPLRRILWRVERGDAILDTREEDYEDNLGSADLVVPPSFRGPEEDECEAWASLARRIRVVPTENAFREGFYDRTILERRWLRTARELARRSGEEPMDSALNTPCQPDNDGDDECDYTEWNAFETAVGGYHMALESAFGPSEAVARWRGLLDEIEACYLSIELPGGGRDVGSVGCDTSAELKELEKKLSGLGVKPALVDATRSWIDHLEEGLDVEEKRSVEVIRRRQSTVATSKEKMVGAPLFLADLADYGKKTPSPPTLPAAYRGTVYRAIRTGDVSALKKLTERAAEIVAMDPWSELRSTVEALTTAATPVARAEREETLLAAILDLAPNEWRRRHVLFLEAGLDERRRRLAQQPGVEAERILNELERLTEDWVVTVGVTNLDQDYWHLDHAMTVILETEIDSPAAGRPDVPGLTDFELARRARQAVRAEIVAERATLKKNTPTPPPERAVHPMLLVYRGQGRSTPEFVKECAQAKEPPKYGACGSSGWTIAVPPERDADAPEFVVVIEKGGH